MAAHLTTRLIFLLRLFREKDLLLHVMERRIFITMVRALLSTMQEARSGSPATDAWKPFKGSIFEKRLTTVSKKRSLA
jgi:hypothetical protein